MLQWLDYKNYLKNIYILNRFVQYFILDVEVGKLDLVFREIIESKMIQKDDKIQPKLQSKSL